VAFPSFDYLALTADAYQTCHPDACVLRQAPGMSDEDRGNFLAAFHPEAPPRLGFVVLGGVFGESVDFSLARLTGVICVGVGLPPPSLTRRELERHFTGRGLDGATVAYHQPAMVKVLQMAGRLLRSPTDRGALCLVDPRFRDRAYRQFFPDHWQPSVVRADSVAGELAHFWHQSDAFSRLRASERDTPA
jgi:Rad3-related DNA helicase